MVKYFIKTKYSIISICFIGIIILFFPAISQSAVCQGYCYPNGCNGVCPANCSAAQDPDCGCVSNNFCCGTTSCNSNNDNDCGAAPIVDTTSPTVTFTINPPTFSSLTVSFTLSATDSGGSGVAAFLIIESSTPPLAPSANDNRWVPLPAPTSHTFTSAGSKTLYAWAKDAAGNVSLTRSASVNITLAAADTTRPTVTTFTIPLTSSSLTVSPIVFIANDNVGVTHYLITNSAIAPLANDIRWAIPPAPTSYIFTAGTADGLKTLYAWTKDAAGNVSLSANDTSKRVTINQRFAVLSPATDGLTFAWGSKMNIRVNRIAGAPITSVGVNIYNLADQYMKTLSLYDDGNHNDGAANNGVWGADAQLILPNGDYYLYMLINQLGPPYTRVRYFSINSRPTCVDIGPQGNSLNKLDIVFIADNFSAQMPDFRTKVQSASDYVLGLTPFNTQRTKINIHRIDSPLNLGCDFPDHPINDCVGDTGFNSNIAAIASLCPNGPNDRIILIANRDFRSYAMDRVAVVSLGDLNDPDYGLGTVAHEFGHSFAGLEDEYVDAASFAQLQAWVTASGSNMNTYITNSVNCSINATCSRWSAVTGPGHCFQGCSYSNNYYRSINNGIMINTRATDYGVINVNEINRLFNFYQ